ncbi:MAG: TonB C-terminal domain-containing protein [Sulfurospirillum sp.]
MPKRKHYNSIGFALAFLLYLLVILSLAFYLQDKIRKNVDYTIKKNSILDITLVEKKPKKTIRHKKKIVRKIVKKKIVSSKPKPKTVAKKIQKKISLKGMFKKIDTKKIIEPKQEAAVQSRKKRVVLKENIQVPVKKELAKKLVETLSFEKRQNLNSSKSGVYDKFRGEIQKILYENWQNTIDTISGSKATVEIYIDKNGTFSYKIVKLSYNDEFNSKLIDFLEEMRNKEFPPFREGGIFKLQVEFKDIRDG